MKLKSLLIAIFITIFPETLATLSPSDKVKNKPKDFKVITEPQDENIFDRNLLENEPAPKDIIVENAAHWKDTSTRFFNGTTLGYVTPWNGQGYDVAKKWKNKFDIISPVWLQIIPKGSSDSKYSLAGTHDIDEDWMKELKKAKTKIFPRILFDKFTQDNVNHMLYKSSERDAINKILINACTKYKFDGFVLEVWSQLAPHFNHELIIKLVTDTAKSLNHNGYNLILVIPPKRPQVRDLFSSKHFNELHPHVYAFSLMTYDFSTVQRPGANAPLYWMKDSVEHLVPDSSENYLSKRSKILMGLNMYGYDYTPDGGGPIIGHQYLDLLKHYKKRLIHDEHDEENFFEVKTISGRHTIFYPTLYSINERIKLARELNVGLSLWELGQGLLYFYDLF